MPLLRLLVLLATTVAGATVLAGCGGGGDVPSDYEDAAQFGAAFSVPPGLQAGSPNEADGSRTVSYTGSDDVSLSIRFAPGKGDAFETYPDQQRAVIGALGDGEVEGQESLDVPGAEDGYELKATQTNADGDDVDVSSVGARKGEDVWVLTVYAKQDGDADASAIARSLRIED